MVIKDSPEFYVVGLSARTSNAKEMSGRGEIGNLWQSFVKDRIAAKVPEKVGTEIVAVYTDYESDQNGEYTYLLGTKVTSIDEVPQGLTARRIPPGRYAVFTSEQGPLNEVVPKTWRRVWAATPEELGGKRAFAADYEIYDDRAQNPENGQVDVYIRLH